MVFSESDCTILNSSSCSLPNIPRYESGRSNSYHGYPGWGPLPTYELPIVGDFDGKGQYGTDNVFLQQRDTPIFNSTLIATMYDVTGYSTSMFGIFGNSITVKNWNTTYSGLVERPELKQATQSQSWSYTAGAFSLKQSGSFIFGGYDEARFNPANSIKAFRDISQINRNWASNLYVSLLNITDDDSPNRSLMPDFSGLNMNINTDVPHIWLPAEICQSFDKVFNLTRDLEHDLYLLDETMSAGIKKKNSTLNFQIAANVTTNETTNIIVPWSFMILSTSIDGKDRPYIPIRCTDNQKSFTLGRSFLQAAYLTVNHDDSTFRLGQALYPGPNSSVVAMPSSAKTGQAISTGTITGIVCGLVVGAAILYLSYLIWQRRKRAQAAVAAEEPFYGSFKPELAASPVDAPPAYRRRHSSNATTRSEVDAVTTMIPPRLDTLREVNEAGEKAAKPSPVELEADPIQLSELYAGFDGAEIGPRDSPNENHPQPMSRGNSLSERNKEPVSPLHEAETRRSNSTNHRLSRSDL